MEVVEWIAYEVADEVPDEKNVGGMGGFFNSGMRWKDYLAAFGEEYHPYAEAIKKNVLELRLKIGGDDHQYSENGVPLFSDGKVASFSYRGWGDLMAAIWAEEEDRDYSYMDFYMACLVKEETP